MSTKCYVGFGVVIMLSIAFCLTGCSSMSQQVIAADANAIAQGFAQGLLYELKDPNSVIGKKLYADLAKYPQFAAAIQFALVMNWNDPAQVQTEFTMLTIAAMQTGLAEPHKAMMPHKKLI